MCPNIPVKQQVKMNRLSGLSGQGAQKQVRLWMAMQVRDPSSHIPGSGHPVSGRFLQHLNNLVLLELSGINLHGKLSALRFRQ